MVVVAVAELAIILGVHQTLLVLVDQEVVVQAAADQM